MPVNPPEKENEEKLEVQIEKPEETNQAALEVDLTEKKEEVKPEPALSISKDERDLLDKAMRRMEYQARQSEKTRKELQELKDAIKNVRLIPQDSDEEQLDELDKIAQKDWKKAVRMLAEQTLQEREKVRLEEQKKYSVIQELEISKNRVREKYPQVEDENSEESRFYREVINENPKLLSNPYGPELAMYKMEEKMREQGRLTPQVKAVVNTEVNRRARVGAGSIPSGRPGSKTNSYTLTQEQKAVADHMGIPYEKYAKTAKRLESGEGIEA